MKKVIFKNNVSAKFRHVANLGICFTVVMALAMSMFFTSCDPDKDDDPPVPPPTQKDADFLAFSFAGIIGTAEINKDAKTIVALAGSSVDLTTLRVNFTLSPAATATVNGAAQTTGVSENNFSVPVVYVVTSGDGSNVKTWTVVITKEGDVVTELTNEIINTGDKTLAPGIYLIKNSLSLNGPNKLTLSPGTVFKFANDTWIDIRDNATLIAQGTAAAPILFTSERSGPQPGDWSGLGIYKCDNSILEYCIFEYGGNSDYWGMVHVQCEMTIKNCTFKDSKYWGFWANCDRGFKDFSNNTFINCANHDGDQHPMKVTYMGYLRNMGAGNTFSNTEPNKGLLVENGGEVTRDMTLKKTNVPYYIKGQTQLRSNAGTATLTIDPGVHLKIMYDTYFIDIRDNGKLVAKGTAAEHIKIEGTVDQKGYWNSIVFYEGALEGNILEYCDITNGGKNDYWRGTIVLNGTRAEQVTVRNCHIAKSSHYGIYFMNENSFALLENNTFADNTEGDTNRP
jgi:hypothetical protein